MFCRNCGTEISDTAKFCPKCGSSITRSTTAGENEKEKIVEDNVLKYRLKPRFHVLYKFLTNLGRALLYVFIIGIAILDSDIVSYFYKQAISIALIYIVVYIIVKMIFGKLQYNVMEYNFYKTKVEYKDGFFNKEEKELKYKFVREVIMTQNILERMCNIGTIRIFTTASSGNYGTNNHNGMRGKNGIYIHCVENVREQYEKIKQIIDEGTPDE